MSRNKHPHYWNLVKELMFAEFKIQYKDSLIGYLWSLLHPLIIFAIMYLVFSVFMRFDVEFYPLYLLLGVIMWVFFSVATTNGITTLLSKENMIKKAVFPLETLIIATCASSALTLVLNLLVFAGFYIFAGATPSFTMLLLPLYLVEIGAIVLGISLLLSALYVKFRDLKHIWTVLLQVGFWVTPIVYPASIVPAAFQPLLTFNPITRILTDLRGVMIYNTLPDMYGSIITLIMAALVLSVGFWVFTKQEKTFAEDL